MTSGRSSVRLRLPAWRTSPTRPTAGTGYPQLSAEYIIKADPDLIFLADTSAATRRAATVAERPGWYTLTAVQGDGVIDRDDDIVSRWGPASPTWPRSWPTR